MKFILLILALAAYGAYSLFGGATPAAPPNGEARATPDASTASAAAMSDLGLSSAADLAATAAAKLSGLEIQPLPRTGCSDSALSPSQVLELLNTMPQAQRVAVAKLLDVSSTVWSAQLYTGQGGVGICLPTKGKMVRVPSVDASAWTFSPDGVTSIVRSAGDAVSGAITSNRP